MKSSVPPEPSPESDEPKVVTVQDRNGTTMQMAGNRDMMRQLLARLEAEPEPSPPAPLVKGTFVDMLENSLARPEATERHPALVPLLRANQLWAAMRSQSPVVRGRAWVLYDNIEVFFGQRVGDGDGIDGWKRWYESPASADELQAAFGEDAGFVQDLLPVVPYVLMFDLIGHSDRFSSAEKEALLGPMWLELAVLLEVQNPSRFLQSPFYGELLRRFRLEKVRRGRREEAEDLLHDAFLRKRSEAISTYTPLALPHAAFGHAAEQIRRRASQAFEPRAVDVSPDTAELVGGSLDGVSMTDRSLRNPHTERRLVSQGRIGRNASDDEKALLTQQLEHRQHHRFEGWKTLAQVAHGRPHSYTTYRNVFHGLLAEGAEPPHVEYQGTRRFHLFDAAWEQRLHDAVARVPTPEGPGTEGWMLRELDDNEWVADRDLFERAFDEGYVGEPRAFYERLRAVRLEEWIWRRLVENPHSGERDLLKRAHDEGHYTGRPRPFYTRLRAVRLELKRRRSGQRSP